MMKIICQLDETVLSDVIDNDDGDDINVNGMMQLHLMIVYQKLSSATSVEADIFRFFFTFIQQQ